MLTQFCHYKFSHPLPFSSHLINFPLNSCLDLSKSMEAKKVVLKLSVHDEKSKQKAMNKVSGLQGVDSIAMDMKDKKLTVTGDIDAVIIVSKLRKICVTEILSVGPAKEAAKKKEEPKKPEEKKDPKDQFSHQAYIPHMPTYYYVRSAEEDPNSCVIC